MNKILYLIENRGNFLGSVYGYNWSKLASMSYWSRYVKFIVGKMYPKILKCDHL